MPGRLNLRTALLFPYIGNDGSQLWSHILLRSGKPYRREEGLAIA